MIGLYLFLNEWKKEAIEKLAHPQSNRCLCHLIQNAVKCIGQEDSGRKKGSQFVHYKYTQKCQQKSTSIFNIQMVKFKH